MRAIVFANGELAAWPDRLEINPDQDLIICADGGLTHCLAYGYSPAVVVGDLDSADPEQLNCLAGQGGEIIRHPARKDETDLELALALAKERGAEEIIVLGALGRRLDMTLANITLLADPARQGLKVSLLDRNRQAFCLTGPGRMFLTGRPGATVSLIPLSARVTGVTLFDLEYPLNEAVLTIGSSRGVSNVLIGDEAAVEIASGRVIIIVDSTPED